MEDIVVIILTLAFTILAAVNQNKKKKAAAENKAPVPDFWKVLFPGKRMMECRHSHMTGVKNLLTGNREAITEENHSKREPGPPLPEVSVECPPLPSTWKAPEIKPPPEANNSPPFRKMMNPLP